MKIRVIDLKIKTQQAVFTYNAEVKKGIFGDQTLRSKLKDLITQYTGDLKKAGQEFIEGDPAILRAIEIQNRERKIVIERMKKHGFSDAMEASAW